MGRSIAVTHQPAEEAMDGSSEKEEEEEEEEEDEDEESTFL